jgi:thymidylate synthase (FAD)
MMIAVWTTQQAKAVHIKYNGKCVICNSSNKLHAHHADPVWHNSSLAFDFDNLVSLCNRCHRYIHSKNLELKFLELFKTTKNFNFLLTTPHLPIPKEKTIKNLSFLKQKFVKIKSITYAGEEDVYDIEVTGPYHNFVSNGFIVHNSSFNEISGRYVEVKDEFYTPVYFRTQKSKNYQYENMDEKTCNELTTKFNNFYTWSYNFYKKLLDQGVAKEQARMILPQGMFTEFYWTVNVRSLMNFLEQRLDEHAQWEIRQYANILMDIFHEKLPWTAEIFHKNLIKNV